MLSDTLNRTAIRLLGRERAWRLGRWLYQGARDELRNDPNTNGEYALLRWVAQSLRSESATDPLLLIDVGANVGDWSEEAARTFQSVAGRSLRLHSFEPAPEQRARLSERLRGLPALQCRIDCRALSNADASARFVVTGPLSGTSAITTRDTEGVDVQTVRLSSVFDEEGYDRALIVKVDTEGHDLSVIRGAIELLSAGRIGIMQFEYNWRWISQGGTLFQVFELLSGLDYRLGKLTGSGVEYYESWHLELDRFIETNYVLVRPDWVSRLPGWSGVFNGSNVAERTSKPR